MRKGTVSCFVVFCFAALMASGCAKKEMVKADQASSTAAVEPAKPATPPAQPPVKEAAIQEQQIKEAPLKEEAVKETRQAAPLDKIYFDFDSYLLSQASRDILYKNAEWILKNSQIKVQIEGHCDERGSDEYNLALGEKRAKSALKYLTTLGVPADKLTVISYGKEKPADPGHDEAAWSKNRRDEFIILGK